jgi:hypothetical protein
LFRACKIVERVAAKEGSAELEKVTRLRKDCEMVREEVSNKTDAEGQAVSSDAAPAGHGLD